MELLISSLLARESMWSFLVQCCHEHCLHLKECLSPPFFSADDSHSSTSCRNLLTCTKEREGGVMVPYVLSYLLCLPRTCALQHSCAFHQPGNVATNLFIYFARPLTSLCIYSGKWFRYQQAQASGEHFNRCILFCQMHLRSLFLIICK